MIPFEPSFRRKRQIAREEAYRAAIAKGNGKSHRDRLPTFAAWASLTQTIAAVLAVIIGGIWSYHIFRIDAEGVPHADLAVTAKNWLLDPNKRYVLADFSVKNTGKTSLTLTCAQIYIQQVRPVPVPSETATAVAARLNQVNMDGRLMPWLIYQQTTEHLSGRASNDKRVIGPDETDHVYVDFVIPSTIQTAIIYGYFQNENADCALTTDGNLKGDGWATLGTYDFTSSQGDSK